MKKSKVKNVNPKSTLDKQLNKIYDTVDLKTTCNHLCECCKTACPSMNYSEFINLINVIWNNTNKEYKLKLICKSIEYFFKVDVQKWGTDIFYKPCMLLEDNRCHWYAYRPMNCRIYGLWPEKEYKERVDRFEQMYKEYGIKREQIPLNTQCPNVKLAKDQKIDIAVINDMFTQLDNLDKQIYGFSDLETKERSNYRTFYDWLMLKVFGEEALVSFSNFMMAADRKIIEEQIEEIKKAVKAKFNKDMPDVRG